MGVVLRCCRLPGKSFVRFQGFEASIVRMDVLTDPGRRKSRQHKGNIIVKFEGIDSIQEAQDLIGRNLEIPIKSISSLKADSYYHYEIIGLGVWTSDYRYIGNVTEILSTGSNDVYIARGSNKDTLIPALKSIIQNINLQNGYMVVELPEGL